MPRGRECVGGLHLRCRCLLAIWFTHCQFIAQKWLTRCFLHYGRFPSDTSGYYITR